MIDTDARSASLRARGLDAQTRSVLLSVLDGSTQELDLSEPTNCEGLGRIRHFTSATAPGWPGNPLPWQPARRHLGPDAVPGPGSRTQVFQNAVCNWRCWYCYVPFTLLRGDRSVSRWVTAERMVDLYLALDHRPPILDLSGGQPDLVPEWVVWTMRALQERGVDREVYLWSDDNLSNDYLFRYLSDDDLALLCDYRGYGRVGCFKGFDADSFAFNTGAAPDLFDRQFSIFGRLLALLPGTHAYATFTTPALPPQGPLQAMQRFADRLQALDEQLPARTVPLRVEVFTPTRDRVRDPQQAALLLQDQLAEAWASVLDERGIHPAFDALSADARSDPEPYRAGGADE